MLIMMNILLFANYIIQNEVEDFTQERIIIQMNMIKSIILCKNFETFAAIVSTVILFT